MDPAFTPSLDERLLGLALAKGWLNPAQLALGGLDAQRKAGTLSSAQVEALHREWSRGHVLVGEPSLEDDAPTALERWEGSAPPLTESGGSASAIFSACWIRSWSHFEDLVLLAEGGMGRIFRARDTRLRRKVALKMLRREDPDLLARFLQEAELQARVNHPHVCRIYEAGEWRGQAFIAMELVEGETFKTAAKELTQLQILALMVQVCEGVHAAHREGLIHRDLKPANLMISQIDGQTRGVVLDFGLARPTQSTGLTQSGMVMGTVHYMSPEQARGLERKVDRRTDIYALGVTLYELLSGHPPFHEQRGLEAMSKVLSEDPPRLAKVADVPRDLDTVVMRCLEKEPQARYDTARALGDELQRVIDGEPILARAVSGPERALKWARKNRPLVAVGALGLCAAIGFGAMALRERLRAKSRAEFAQRFGQEAERIEALARYIKLAPPHDLRAEMRDIESRVVRLSEEVQAMGGLAEAPGNYALGRARLALGQFERAQEHLDRARSFGFDTPELRSALGRVWIERHQQALEDVWRSNNEDTRKERLSRLHARASSDILPILASGARASLIPVAYLEGQVAWASGRWEEAASRARAAQLQAPWFYEAKILESQSLLSLSMLKVGDERVSLLTEAQRCALEAAASAPSDRQVLMLAGRIGVRRYGLYISEKATRDSIRTSVQRVLETLRLLDPSGQDASQLEAAIFTTDAINAQVVGRSGSESLRRALALLSPWMNDPSPTFESLEGAMRAECYAARFPDMGEPIPWLDQALVHGRRALEQRPGNTELAQELARVSVWRISEGTLRGQPPWDVFESALGVVRKALEREPQARTLKEALGYLWGERAEYERTHGVDPRPSLEQSIRAFEEGNQQAPSFRSFYGIANAALMRGQWEVDHGQASALQSLDKADSAYRMAQSLAPFHAALPTNLVEVAIWKGKAFGPSTPQGRLALEQGETSFQAGIKVFPKVASLWLRGAQVAEVSGRTEEARARAQRALALDPHSPEIRRMAEAGRH